MSMTSSICRPLTRPLTRAIGEAGGGGWTPLSLPSLVAWYDPSDLSTLFQDTAGTTPVTAVGQSVARINDKSGNGLNATQATGAAQPTLAVDSLGNYCLRFNGTSQFLEVASSTASFKFLHDGTGGCVFGAFALTSPLTTGKTYSLVCTGGTSAAAVGMYLRSAEAVGSQPSSQQLYCGIANGSAFVVDASAAAFGSVRGDGVGQVLGVTYKTQAGTDFNFYTSGASYLARSESAAPSTANSFFSLRIGNRAGDNFFSGDFYGMVIASSEPTADERNNIITHLGRKYDDIGCFIAVGDSYTFNTAYGFYMQGYYPARLDASLRSAGIRQAPVNYGVSGDSTGNIIARLSQINQTSVPKLAIIYAGTNDPTGNTTVQASPTPTATTFTVGSGAKYGAGAIITVGAESAVVQSVSTNAITLTAPLAGGAPAAGTAVSLDTQANIVKIAESFRARGVGRIVVVGTHYYNFASGGDTTSAQLASLETLRAEQSAAASELGVPYVDLYAYMRALIVAGTYTQGDDLAWHVAVGNAHLNTTGEQIVSDAIFAALQAQGWT